MGQLKAIRLEKLKCDVDDPIVALPTYVSPLLSNTFNIGVFSGRTSRNQFFEPGVAGKRSEMAHQCSADALSLVFVDHSECHLGCPGAHDDITPAANDCAAATISHHCHQGDMAGEIDVQKEVNFLFGKIASQAEEATIKRLSAGAIDSCDEIGPIARRKRADFNPASVAGAVRPSKTYSVLLPNEPID